ncbi:hypothetical protein Tco_1063376, partial [Tanacetum coccineum]
MPTAYVGDEHRGLMWAQETRATPGTELNSTGPVDDISYSDSNKLSWGIPLMNAGELLEMDPYEK